MITRNSVLLSLLATVLVVCLVPASVFGDGPWDIDHGVGGQETHGGTLYQGQDVIGNSATRPDLGTESGIETPSYLSGVVYYWLNNLGLNRLAERVIVDELKASRQVDRSANRKTRR